MVFELLLLRHFHSNEQKEEQEKALAGEDRLPQSTELGVRKQEEDP